MATTIAVSGKGGSGKTTISAMIIRWLMKRPSKAILAVDADPNSCLGLAMGVVPESTIAEIREQTRAKPTANDGLDRVRLVEYGIHQAITEAKGFDLLTMGRPEGPSCYCAVNSLLRKFLDDLNAAYEFVVIDNEAGMEHLSRRTTNNVDLLIIAAEPGPVGKVTAKRIFELARKLPIEVKQIGIIWNRTELADSVDGIETFGCVPYDQAVLDAAMQGKTVLDLDMNTPAFAAVKNILKSKIGKVNRK
jgi:CO dehydrogenase maturation factor